MIPLRCDCDGTTPHRVRDDADMASTNMEANFDPNAKERKRRVEKKEERKVNQKNVRKKYIQNVLSKNVSVISYRPFEIILEVTAVSGVTLFSLF